MTGPRSPAVRDRGAHAVRGGHAGGDANLRRGSGLVLPERARTPGDVPAARARPRSPGGGDLVNAEYGSARVREAVRFLLGVAHG